MGGGRETPIVSPVLIWEPCCLLMCGSLVPKQSVREGIPGTSCAHTRKGGKEMGG